MIKSPRRKPPNLTDEDVRQTFKVTQCQIENMDEFLQEPRIDADAGKEEVSKSMLRKL